MKKSTYFMVRVKVATEVNGKTKWITEQYVVDAVDVSEAETKTVSYFSQNAPGVEIDVHSATATKIVAIL